LITDLEGFEPNTNAKYISMSSSQRNSLWWR